MNISIIWILSENKKENKKTLGCLKEELAGSSAKNELFVYLPDGISLPEDTSSVNASLQVFPAGALSAVEIYRDCANRVSGDYVTMLYGGDKWSKGYLGRVAQCAGKAAVPSWRTPGLPGSQRAPAAYPDRPGTRDRW